MILLLPFRSQLQRCHTPAGALPGSEAKRGLAVQITEKDEAVLEHLIDISAEELGEDDEEEKEDEDEDDDDVEQNGFRLTFTFEPNEFFSETVLVRPPTDSSVDSG